MKKGKRTADKKIKKNKKVLKNKKMIKIIFAIIVLIFVGIMANNYIIFDKNKSINLIINNNNVTSQLKNEVIIEEDNIYISEADIKNFFDKYITEEGDKIITTYEKKIAEVSTTENIININGADKKTETKAIKKGEIMYLPISEMTEVYNIEIGNKSKTKVVTLDSLDKEQEKAIIKSGTSVKSSTNFIAKTIDRIKKGESVVIISSDKKYSKIRTENGKIGYIKTKKLTNEYKVRENMEEEKQINGKVNMTFDYYSEVTSAPNRDGTKIEGVNVVSPSFFYIDKNATFKENIGDEGKAYIDWAHNNGYKVWAMASNAPAAKEDLEITSRIMNSYEKRKKLIGILVNRCVQYGLDGINIDFENMKAEDKDVYSRFIIELEPRLKEIGVVLSVDVTAPDGGETWSMCFDRNVIGNVADYIVFMAYDEYGTSSTKSGTTAGYDWVKLNLTKFLQTEEIKSDKIVLGIPLYTRIWTENKDGTLVKSSTVNMKDVDSVLPSDVEKKWDDQLKQYYVEFEKDSTIKKMWIEDIKSLKEKVSLITDNKLGGVASWQKGMESDEVWSMLNEELSK
ncbi:MAG: glycosyl hydrolase family 18 protein [Clostridia bacterium]